MVLRVSKESKAKPVQLARQALTEHKVCRASKGSRVFKVKLAQPAHKALLALTARRVCRVTSARWVYKARREFRVRPVLPAHQAHKGRRAM